MPEALLRLLALAACVGGTAAFAVAAEARRPTDRQPPRSRDAVLRLRLGGSAAIGGALVLLFRSDVPSVAPLLWIMMLFAGGVLAAFALAWRARVRARGARRRR